MNDINTVPFVVILRINCLNGLFYSTSTLTGGKQVFSSFYSFDKKYGLLLFVTVLINCDPKYRDNWQTDSTVKALEVLAMRAK